MSYRTSRLVLLLAFLSCIALTGSTLVGCVTEKAVYEAAVAEGTADALRDYLELYPEGKYAPLARPDLDEARWKEASTSETAEAYETYLVHHPDGIHAQAAETAAPKAAWKEMDFINDRAAIEAFLVKYEYSAYANKARSRMALLDLYPSHLSIGEVVLIPAETGGWQITADIHNIGTRDILDVGVRVGFEDEEGNIIAQLESFMNKQTPYGEDRLKEMSAPLVPGETRTFQFDVAPKLIPDGWIDDADHVRLVLATLTLADA